MQLLKSRSKYGEPPKYKIQLIKSSFFKNIFGRYGCIYLFNVKIHLTLVRPTLQIHARNRKDTIVTRVPVKGQSVTIVTSRNEEHFEKRFSN